MSILNTKVSKIVVGVLAVAVLVVGFATVKVNKASAAVTAAGIQSAVTVSSGASGASAMMWQEFLNTYGGASLTVDGKYGPMSAAAAKVWQASRGLVADGVLGALSRAAAVAQIGGGAPVVGGATCPNGYLLADNCAAPAAATGALCPNGNLLANNCQVATVTPSSTGEGSITLDYDAIPAANVVINKGIADQSAIALKVKATGSNMNVSRVWLDFNARLWLYANEASLWDGSTELARTALSSSAFSEVTAGSKWQLQFNNLNVNVADGATKILTLKLSRPMLTQVSGTVTLQTSSSIRATDNASLSEAYSPSATRAMNLTTTAATAGTMTTSLNLNSPVAQSVGGLSITAGVLTPVKLADFDFKSKDSAINITTVVATLAGGTIADEVASVELRDGASVLSSVTGAATATFSSLDVDVAKNATKTLSVWAQMNPVAAVAAAGYVAKGQGITATLDSSATVATDEEFNTLTITSADPAGNTQYFFQYAPTLALGTVSGTQVEGSAVGKKAGNFSFALSVTAPSDSNIYVNATDGLLCGGTYPITKIGNAACNSVTIGGTLGTTLTVSGTSSKGTGTLATWDKVAAGSSRTFTVTGYIPDGNAAGFTGMTIATNGLQWTEIDNATIVGTDTVEQTWGLTDFKTPSVYVTL